MLRLCTLLAILFLVSSTLAQPQFMRRRPTAAAPLPSASDAPTSTIRNQNSRTKIIVRERVLEARAQIAQEKAKRDGKRPVVKRQLLKPVTTLLGLRSLNRPKCPVGNGVGSWARYPGWVLDDVDVSWRGRWGNARLMLQVSVSGVYVSSEANCLHSCLTYGSSAYPALCGD
jgi:hypothetical protein